VRNILHNLIRRVPSTGNLSHSEMYVVDLTHAVARALNLQLSHDGEYDQMHTILLAPATGCPRARGGPNCDLGRLAHSSSQRLHVELYIHL